jgi:hypothetical protein
MVLPIEKPTASRRNLGFKLMGNISKRSYLGFAMSYRFGWYKKYLDVDAVTD